MRALIKILLSCMLLSIGSMAFAVQSDSNGQTAAGASQELPVSANEAHQGGCLTLSQAVERVRRQHNGRIVSAETIVSGGRETHVIKVLTPDGKVKTVRVPGCRV